MFTTSNMQIKHNYTKHEKTNDINLNNVTVLVTRISFYSKITNMFCGSNFSQYPYLFIRKLVETINKEKRNRLTPNNGNEIANV